MKIYRMVTNFSVVAFYKWYSNHIRTVYFAGVELGLNLSH